ncbi:hypothetical protein AGABI1DRAFT_116217 [Agaricus bisporus var. burnettii JB137-S8]|uniref:DUF2433 domain-containing protein n=2 Tax=Agaricus bisporus var. burnettii TaxID=192524 RepID=K5WKD3_AGABU|nr:uncharacterized protein AGABI1DRAFT_116217 [Agaricus bisporus var. burnettii JB137-S8]EKM75751.1 hypothetical protein AGABI1DRAFT_116217 [Agaricus bisporus var. burnettii JB137-S8]KAF7776406.1 hypothetical protein Agabi119p4_4799 [Agaricus bisporus var. burnettii]
MLTVLDSAHARILCVADIRGKLSALNDLARQENASAIIHTGDFGFFEHDSLARITDRTLRHVTQYSPLIPQAQRSHLLAQDAPDAIRATVNVSLLSEFPLLLAGQLKLNVPVFTVWGTCEDVAVLEKFRSAAYAIDNLHIIDEASSHLIDLAGVKLRLFGLGGALVSHKMFDNGEGKATIAGGGGTMWTTALQIGELVDTAQRVFDPSETRLLVTHASPGREGIISQLALVLKADLTISAGLHFRYASSYNEFSVQPDFEGFRHKLAIGKDSWDRVWESVKGQVDNVIDGDQRILLEKALSVVERIPTPQPSTGPGATATGEEPAWKNCWNWNLCDAAYGALVLDIKDGRVSSELKSQGFNYAYRRSATAPTPNSTTSALPPQTVNGSQLSTKQPTPAPPPQAEKPLPPHLANKSTTHTPPPTSPAPGTPKINGTPEKEKEKQPLKKDKRRDSKRDSKSGRDTPDVPKAPTRPESSASAVVATPDTNKSTVDSPAADDIRSPADTPTSGIRSPKSTRPARHPWTIFMKMPLNIQVTEADIKEFFAETKDAITKVNFPTHPGRARLAYIEFVDEAGMKAGLEKHAEKIKDITPEVKQATDRESRESNYRGSGRGRGRGGAGGYAARGLSAAGLTSRGGPPRHHGSGDAANTDA